MLVGTVQWEYILRIIAPLLSLLPLCTTLACSGSQAPTLTTSATPTPTATAMPTATPSPTDTPACDVAAQWTTIDAGDNASCWDGQPYRFYVRRADPSKLVVWFQGGGACWTRGTCDRTMAPTFAPGLDYREPWRFNGMFDFDNPDNPVRDHTFLVVPYCTADVHLGSNDKTYEVAKEGQEPLLFRHRGSANVDSALEWMIQNSENPKTIVVAGSSAGAVPSPFYAHRIAQSYPNSRLIQFGEGTGGYRYGPRSDRRSFEA